MSTRSIDDTAVVVIMYLLRRFSREERRRKERERERDYERRFNRAERKASVVLLVLFIGPFFRRSNKTPPIGARGECSLLSLSLSPKVKKKIRRQKFSLARRRRQLRASSSSSSLKPSKKARCSLRLVYPPPPPPPPPRERARAEEAGAKRESRRQTDGPRVLFSSASVSSRGVCLTRKSERRHRRRGGYETVLNGKRFRRETEKRERGGNLKEKSALDKRAEDAFLRGLIRTFA